MNTTPQGIEFVGWDTNHLVYQTAGLGTKVLSFGFAIAGANITLSADLLAAGYLPFIDIAGTATAVVGTGPFTNITDTSTIYYIAKTIADAQIIADATGTLAAAAYRINSYVDAGLGFLGVSCYAAGDITNSALSVGIGGSVGLTVSNQADIYQTVPGAAPLTCQWTKV